MRLIILFSNLEEFVLKMRAGANHWHMMFKSGEKSME